MSVNLVDAVQEKMGYPPLHKVDPNTQEVIIDDKSSAVNFLAQAAIPTVLIGMYKVSVSEEGAASLLRGNNSSSWVSSLFGNNEQDVVDKVADYAHTTHQEALNELEKVSHNAIEVLNENLTTKDAITVKNLLGMQVNTLKKYLPGALQIGKVLHDNTLDDRTNKMSGPMSNHMHWLENLLSESKKQKDPNNPVDPTRIH